jgi:hypothetical protein
LPYPGSSPRQFVLQEALDKFSRSTGLNINFDKSHMVPINVPERDIEVLATQFACQIGRMPFTYLGPPLGSTRPTISELIPLVCRLERKLTSSSSFFVSGSKVTIDQISTSFHASAFSLLPAIASRFNQAVG